MENHETPDKDNDNDSQEHFSRRKYYSTINLQNRTIKANHVEDGDNDPRDAIHQLGQKLNQLTLTLHPPSEPTEEVLRQIY